MILVTGAAGLIGGATVQALVRAGHAVVGLVHRNPEIFGNDGAPVLARLFDPNAAHSSGVVTLRGDVQAEGLGLDHASIEWLQRHIKVVIHCAALVRFEADAADLQAVNVRGTQNVAALFPRARFVHVSTAYVCGLANGAITETPCDPAGAFGNGYEQSKALAEASLCAMRPDACIVRPSIVVGEASSGRIRDFDTIYRAFKFIAEGRIDKVPVAPFATLNFVPIDYVVDSICHLASPDVKEGACNGRILHLAARQAVSAARFLSLIGKVPGLAAPKIIPPDEEAVRLNFSERLVQPYLGYFKRNPQFETAASASLLNRHAPDMGDAELLRQIAYCVEAGFIRAPAGSSVQIDG